MNLSRSISRRAHLRALAMPLLFVCLLLASPVHADLTIYKMYSIEWLVDTCDHIAIVRFESDQGFTGPQIVKTFKGDPQTFRWPMAPVEDETTYIMSQATGKLRLLFVRGQSALVQSIKLARYRDIKSPSVPGAMYGVDQYGELLLSESALYRCIEQRLASSKTHSVARVHQDGSSLSIDKYPIVFGATPWTFPLQNTDEMYSLRVPSDEDRRDHFLELLKQGDAVEKIFAIEELSKMKDANAHAAVRAATKCEHATTIYHNSVVGQEVDQWNVQSVRDAAIRAVQLLDAHP